MTQTRSPTTKEGAVGLFELVSQEAFISILQLVPLHSRMVLTTFVNKVAPPSAWPAACPARTAA